MPGVAFARALSALCCAPTDQCSRRVVVQRRTSRTRRRVSAVVDLGSPAGPEPVTVAGPHRGRRRQRWRLWLAVGLLGTPLAIGAVAAGVGVGAAGTAGNQRLDTGPRSGPAPAFKLPDLADPTRPVTLAAFRGRPVVVNFWASWCVPCRREMPRLAEAARRLEGRIAFVGINYKDRRGDAMAFVEKMRVSYPSGFDRDGAVGRRFGVYGLPTTVFVDAEGRIVGRYLGELKAATLDRLLRRLEGI